MPSSSHDRTERWTLLAAGAIIALAAFLLPRIPGVDEDAVLAERQRADSAYRAFLDAKAQRDGTTIMAQQAQRQIRRSVSDMGIRLRRVQRVAAVTPDVTGDSLRAVITTLRAEADTLLTVQITLAAQLDTVEAALLAERKAASAALREADATILAYRDALDASQIALQSAQTGCQVLGRPCPTRTQAMAAGAVLALLAVVVR